MRPDDESLERVARHVADGEPVDWERESGSTPPGPLHQLRAIEVIRSIHRVPEPVGADSSSVRRALNSLDETFPLAFSDESDPIDRTPSRWGHLHVRERIGRGAFGTVYLAREPTLEKDVALKLFRSDLGSDPGCVKRFLDEARRMARVQHPNVLLVYGADVHEGRVGIWTELIKGRTLEDLLRIQGPFGARETAIVGLDLLRALAGVHSTGLVHRDVKTSNVMRETGGRIVLMDFSSASECRGLAELPPSETFAGTVAYMAPELFQGGAGGVGADIYSLGVLLYRLLTACFPVPARTVAELRTRHRQAAPIVPLQDLRPDLPSSLCRIVERALAPRPEDCFTSAGEMERALAGYLGAIPSETAERRPARRSRRLLAAATALLVTVAIAFVLLLDSPEPLDVRASLFRAGSRSEERLAPGTQLSRGDQLFLEVEGSEEMFVYVVNEDQAGDAYLLFPLPGLDLRNPLRGDRLHRLPGTVDGEERFWDVTSAGRREKLFLVASREKLDLLEAEIEKLPRAGDAPRTVRREEPPPPDPPSRGVGGLSPGRAQDRDESPAFSQVFARIAALASEHDDVWVWEVELENRDR